MPMRAILALCFAAAIGSPAADDRFMIHENLHVNQKTPFAISYDYKVKSTATTNGNAIVTDKQTGENWKLTLTILAEKDGSATQTQADVDRDSFDTAKIAGGETKKSPCPFAAKTIVLTRHPDESFSNDFQGNAGDDDTNMLNELLTPDEDIYPDKPVTVGETWDNSDKISRHIGLGPQDQILSKCRLDWVKTIDGKQMAQISSSVGIIYHEQGNVEEDLQYAATLLVDVAAGMIVKCDQKGSSTYSTLPTEATQVSGGTEFTFHSELLPGTATTKP